MKRALSIILVLSITGISLFAHVQMIYTPSNTTNSSRIPLKLVFGHPYTSGLIMDIGKDEDGNIYGFESICLIHKSNRKEAKEKLIKTTFSSKSNSASAYDLILDRKLGVKGGGDWIILAIPYPYFEESGKYYMQQITKQIINRGRIETDWYKRVAKGYPEILPYVKPYAIKKGSIFRGCVVDNDGKNVPNCRIEIEYINYGVVGNAFGLSHILDDTNHIADVILSDNNGNFSYIIPEKGHWAFTAIEAGTLNIYNGQKLNQDAVIWIEAN